MMLTESQTVLPGLPTLVIKALVESASLQFSLYKVVRFLFPKRILLSWFKNLISALSENVYVPGQVVVVEFKYTYTLVKPDRSKTQRPQLPCQPQPTWAIDLFPEDAFYTTTRPQLVIPGFPLSFPLKTYIVIYIKNISFGLYPVKRSQISLLPQYLKLHRFSKFPADENKRLLIKPGYHTLYSEKYSALWLDVINLGIPHICHFLETS